ncbi:MAG: nitroreductase family protein [Elusimicrobia bacterium]|nr:nitroreductase family protein [Elusimicrobiota bacterium]
MSAGRPSSPGRAYRLAPGAWFTREPLEIGAPGRSTQVTDRRAGPAVLAALDAAEAQVLRRRRGTGVALDFLLAIGAVVRVDDKAGQVALALRALFGIPGAGSWEEGRRITRQWHVRRSCLDPALTVAPGAALPAAWARRTVRRFSGHPLPSGAVASLFRAAYGFSYVEAFNGWELPHRTVPSGGGFFPLRWRWAAFDRAAGTVAVWDFDGYRLRRTRLRVPFDVFLERAFVPNPGIAFGAAAGLALVTADLTGSARKSGGSAYPLALLEAGHACQNPALAAQSVPAGTCELWGVRADWLLGAMGCAPGELFMNAVLVGATS